MFDMFSLKSAMITTSVFEGRRPEPSVFLPNCCSKGCFIVFLKYVKVIYFICRSDSRKLITLTLNYECPQPLNKMTKDDKGCY